MRRDGGAEVAAWVRVAGHTYAMHHCQRGWEFKARKGKGERGAKWHQNPQLDTACAPTDTASAR